MKTVGIRELKNRLSEFVRQARSGETLLVTDRGEVVAELAPPEHIAGEHGAPASLVALAKRGRVTLGTGPNDPGLYPRRPKLLKRRLAAQLLDEERGLR